MQFTTYGFHGITPLTHGCATCSVSGSPATVGMATKNVVAAEPVTMRRRMRRCKSLITTANRLGI